MKYIPYILILFLIGIIIYLWNKEPIDVKPHQAKIDSLEVEINKSKFAIEKLIKQAEIQDIFKKLIV